ncbi:MAG: N-acetylmuramoyl-L-alanine amidase [bacterium]
MRFNITPLLIICCAAGWFNRPLPAQNGDRATVPDRLRLRLVFPIEGDTLNFERVRFAGSVLPGASVEVQNQNPRVYSTGAFVGMVDLQPGINLLVFTARDRFGEVKDTLRVFRTLPRVSLPEVPTNVDDEQIFPTSDVYLSAGDALEVGFFGSPGGRASFSISKMVREREMVELQNTDARGLKGVYRGSVIMPSVDHFKPKRIEYKLRGKGGRLLKFKSRGKIHIIPANVPFVGITKDFLNVVRSQPDGEILMELPAAIKLQIVGLRDGVSKVKVAENVIGFMASASLQILPPGTLRPMASLGSVGVVHEGDWTQLRINISERVPFKIAQFIEPSALEITFYRAHPAPQWDFTLPETPTFSRLFWRRKSSEQTVLRIEFQQKQQWGYQGRYVGRQFWLRIRQAPELSNNHAALLQGLTIAVDAGHGGHFEGAVSPTGLLEKDLNLQFAEYVAEMLKQEGARVIKTRTSDTTLSLQNRMNLAVQSQAHLFISLHNNSIGPATDPLRPRGTSTYYTMTHALDVAQSVYDRLLNLGLKPFGRNVSTYFVTRQTSLISFLVEGAFVTHPDDEMLLLNDNFVQQLAKAVVDGVKDFVAGLLSERGQLPKLNTPEYAAPVP